MAILMISLHRLSRADASFFHFFTSFSNTPHYSLLTNFIDGPMYWLRIAGTRIRLRRPAPCSPLLCAFSHVAGALLMIVIFTSRFISVESLDASFLCPIPATSRLYIRLHAPASTLFLRYRRTRFDDDVPSAIAFWPRYLR